jgi:hypothetical protein
VIRGEFKERGQRDLAILCSKDRVSSIVIFWGGSEKTITEIKASPDKDWLQGIGDSEIGFSRSITPVGKKFILEHYKWYGGPKPPPITHQGINEAFVGKASVVHYYYQGKWLRLSGAD